MMEQGINVSADEMIDELVHRVAQLTMEVAAKDVIIRKLQTQPQAGAPQHENG